MRPETIALHGGFDGDPATRAVAVPIYQTVAYSFENAAHGAALFDLEADGYRYTRIGNPTVDVLERRVALLEGGIDALAVASGQTAMYYTMVNLADAGQNIVSVPQLYGTTHTLFAHLLPRQGIEVRLAKSDRPAELAALIDEHTRAFRWWSTTRCRARCSSARSTSAPTSWCTRSPNSSAATAPASEAPSSTAAASAGPSTPAAIRA
jgi:O-acetylhomoserine (thiol)-lyase